MHIRHSLISVITEDFFGRDALLIDAYGASLMGLEIDEIGYLGLAEKWGVGSLDIDSARIVKLNEPQESQAYPARSAIVDHLTKNVSEKSACSACFASLVRALHILEQNGNKCDIPIAIGQGWQGAPFKGIGIGRCAANAEHPVKGCPPSAQEIIRVILRSAFQEC